MAVSLTMALVSLAAVILSVVANAPVTAALWGVSFGVWMENLIDDCQRILDPREHR